MVFDLLWAVRLPFSSLLFFCRLVLRVGFHPLSRLLPEHPWIWWEHTHRAVPPGTVVLPGLPVPPLPFSSRKAACHGAGRLWFRRLRLLCCPGGHPPEAAGSALLHILRWIPLLCPLPVWPVPSSLHRPSGHDRVQLWLGAAENASWLYSIYSGPSCITSLRPVWLNP